jgi:hypothetical protein
MKCLTIISLVSTLLVSQACSAETTSKQALPSNEINRNEMRSGNNENTDKITTQDNVAAKPDKTFIGNTKGLLVLNSQRPDRKDFIRFYNDDGALWYEFTFYYDDSDGNYEYENENFAPFAFHQDYFLLALRLAGEDKNRYEVIVNEETGLRKFVKKSDPALKFETWEDHILKVFAVEFDPRENALRDGPGGNVKNPNLPQDATFRPVQISGEWLKVRWDRSEQPKKDVESGWVRWRDNSQILVDLFYFS